MVAFLRRGAFLPAHRHGEARVGAIAASLPERSKLARALRPGRMVGVAHDSREGCVGCAGGGRRRLAQVEGAMADAQPSGSGEGARTRRNRKRLRGQ